MPFLCFVKHFWAAFLVWKKNAIQIQFLIIKWGSHGGEGVDKGEADLTDVLRGNIMKWQRRSYRAIPCLTGVLSSPPSFSKYLANSPIVTIKHFEDLCSTSPVFLCPLKSSTKVSSPLLWTDWPVGLQPSGRGWRCMPSWQCVCVCSGGSVSYMPSSCAIW